MAAQWKDEKINVWSTFVAVSPVAKQRADRCLGSKAPLRAHLAVQILSFPQQCREVCENVFVCERERQWNAVTKREKVV